MKNWFFLLKTLFGALIDSIRTGRGYVLELEERWLERYKEHECLKTERNLIWDCVDTLINGGSACDFCQFKEGCHLRETHPNGCEHWCIRDLTSEEVRECEPRTAPISKESAASVSAQDA